MLPPEGYCIAVVVVEMEKAVVEGSTVGADCHRQKAAVFAVVMEKAVVEGSIVGADCYHRKAAVFAVVVVEMEKAVVV